MLGIDIGWVLLWLVGTIFTYMVLVLFLRKDVDPSDWGGILTFGFFAFSAVIAWPVWLFMIGIGLLTKEVLRERGGPK